MKFTYNAEGTRKKELVNAVSHLLVTDSVYQGPPSFAYKVDGYTIDRYGNLIAPNEATKDDLFRLTDALFAEYGFKPEEDLAQLFSEDDEEDDEAVCEPDSDEEDEAEESDPEDEAEDSTEEPETEASTMQEPAAPDAPENGPQLARGVNLLNQPKTQNKPVLSPTAPGFEESAAPDYPTPAPGGIGSKNEPPATLGQNLSQLGSKFEPKVGQNLSHLTYYRNKYIEYNNINPHYPPTQPTDNGFTAFWDAYPNKKGKQPAFKKWQNGQYDLTVILPVLEKQKKLRAWVKENGQYIPHAKTYLHQKRYEDVLPVGEEYYILDFKEPKTEREIALRLWLEKTNPELLHNDNQKINSTLESERVLFEKLIAMCENNVEKAYAVMRHGWKLRCIEHLRMLLMQVCLIH